MGKQTITVPDIGGAENVDIIEVCVAPGDVLAADDSILVLESDKASMEVPCPVAGKVLSVSVKEGDTVSEGDAVIELEVEGASTKNDTQAVSKTASAPEPASAPAPVSSGGADVAVSVPDIGGAEGVDVIEVCVSVGDEVAEGDSLIVLESDKASMEIPSPAAGKVVSLSLNEGDKVSEGDALLVLASAGGASTPAPVEKPQAPAEPVASGAPSNVDVNVPDIGGATGVDVIEVSVAVGDDVSEGDSLIVLESDKASMEIPSPSSGKVVSVAISEGDKASEGSAILTLEVSGGVATPSPAASASAEQHEAPAVKKTSHKPQSTVELLHEDIASVGSEAYAGPASRKLARQMGVDLSKVKGSGPKSRISKDDIKAYVKKALQSVGQSGVGVSSGSGIPPVPAVDFAKFGEIELVKMSKIKKLTAANMSRNWLNVPHVTQFDDADITDLESFRKGMKAEAEKSGVKLTPLPFLLKACAAALRAEPSFNVSLHADGEHIVQKNYVHIGIAVDTPNGLMVPVIRDVDKKGLYEIAKETIDLAKKARDGKLMPKDMQGGCFTISSLGPIGGTGFTPIVNAPEVAILGVSKASMKPVWNGSEFIPRQMLPLCLSYDHRAINGGDAGRFFTYLTSVLGDLRRFLL